MPPAGAAAPPRPPVAAASPADQHGPAARSTTRSRRSSVSQSGSRIQKSATHLPGPPSQWTGARSARRRLNTAAATLSQIAATTNSPRQPGCRSRWPTWGRWRAPCPRAARKDATSWPGAQGDGTLRHAHNLLNGAFALAVRWDWVGTDPVARAAALTMPAPNPAVTGRTGRAGRAPTYVTVRGVPPRRGRRPGVRGAVSARRPPALPERVSGRRLERRVGAPE